MSKIPTSMHHSMGLIPQPWKRGWLVSNGIPLKGIGGGTRGCHWWWQSVQTWQYNGKTFRRRTVCPWGMKLVMQQLFSERSANISTSCHQMSKNSSKLQLLQLMTTRQWAFPFVILARRILKNIFIYIAHTVKVFFSQKFWNLIAMHWEKIQLLST